jgi:hypothetical protein
LNCINSLKNKPLLFEFFISTVYILALGLLFEPRWETNDDVAMSMVAHGYGIAKVGMPNLIFSNVLWGYLIRAIPPINGILGYSIATIGVSLVFGTLLLHALRRLGLGWRVALPLFSLIITRPVLFPQFTINAGLLTVGAVVCFHLYGKIGSKRSFLIGCVLAFLGYLIRSEEFLLVLFISCPLIPFEIYHKDPLFKRFSFILLVAITCAVLINYHAYQSEAWQAFRSLNIARAPITDYGADALLKVNPEILAKHGYSNNDIDLLASWFFVDSGLANPASLSAMIKELGPLPASTQSLVNIYLALEVLIKQALLPLFLTALVLCIIFPSRRLFLMWALAFFALLILAVMGRPGIVRVYIPMFSLLVIAPFLLSVSEPLRLQKILHHLLLFGVLGTAGILNSISVFSESKASQMHSSAVRQDLIHLSEDTVVVWGPSFPFEDLYPSMKSWKPSMSYKLLGLGVFTLAPFSVSYSESKLSQGMINRLVSDKGVAIFGSDQYDRLAIYLKIYCRERLGGNLVEAARKQYGKYNITWRRCESESHFAQ